MSVEMPEPDAERDYFGGCQRCGERLYVDCDLYEDVDDIVGLLGAEYWTVCSSTCGLRAMRSRVR